MQALTRQNQPYLSGPMETIKCQEHNAVLTYPLNELGLEIRIKLKNSKPFCHNGWARHQNMVQNV